MPSIIELLGPKHRDYLKVAWRIAKSYSESIVPATLRFIVYREDLDDDSKYHLDELKDIGIELIKDRDNMSKINEFVKTYRKLYDLNTVSIVDHGYYKQKRMSGIAVDIAFFLRSIDNEIQETENVKIGSKYITPSTKTRAKITTDRSIRDPKIVKVPKPKSQRAMMSKPKPMSSSKIKKIKRVKRI